MRSDCSPMIKQDQRTLAKINGVERIQQARPQAVERKSGACGRGMEVGGRESYRRFCGRGRRVRGEEPHRLCCGKGRGVGRGRLTDGLSAKLVSCVAQ